jgi:nucleotide-binding universal stress UspA family protein
MPWNKILCAVDFSQGSRDALKLAAELAAERDAELVIAHIWTPPSFFVGETIGLPASVLADLAATADRELTAWRTEAIGLGARRATMELLSGSPWFEIVGIAKHDRAIDLIVVGTHGRTGIKHALVGSVAEKVVRHSPVAVLVVPPRW